MRQPTTGCRLRSWVGFIAVCVALTACADDDAADDDGLAAKFDRLAGAIVQKNKLQCECVSSEGEECTGGEDPRKMPAWRQCLLDVAVRDPALFSEYFDCGIEAYDAESMCVKSCDADVLECVRLRDEMSEECPVLSKEQQSAITACKKMFDRPFS